MGWNAAGLCRAMFSTPDNRRESIRRDYETEVQFAGWVPPILDPALVGLLRDLTASPSVPGSSGTAPSTEVPETLLARVYAHQDC